MVIVPSRSRFSVIAALLAAVVVAALLGRGGSAIFSPGPLLTADSTPVVLGGVTSHAALGNRCEACHVAPWSGDRMDARCLACHTDITRAIADTTSLHGALDDATGCRSCHDAEHRGGRASSMTLRSVGALHERFGFPLTGAHRKVACDKCHIPGDGYAKAPKTCIGCHAKDDKHKNGFGPDCASCHNTRRWTGARFAHDVFPLNHGRRGASKCTVCHEDAKNYKSYTCYNCHEHSRERVAAQHRGEVRAGNLDNCIKCHPGGRGEGDEHEGRGER
ncbi:MAG: hypothetical protein NTW72_11830 [Gemmatimonadetes bacterium]|nr:hypothetical protein [Gemmatimonadota bacterium]